MTHEHESHEVLLKVRYPNQPARDGLATSISERMLFVSTDDEPGDAGNLTVSVEFPGLLAPVVLNASIVSRVASNPATGQLAGLLLELRPASDLERAHLAALLARLRSGDFASRPEPFRLLLVDDSDLAHKVIAAAVARTQRAHPVRFVELVGASSVSEALGILGRMRVDMALVDQHMPERTGDELIRAIRGDAGLSALPIVVISDGGRAVRDTVLRAGADLVLDKPLMLKPLLATITALVTSLPPSQHR